MDELVTLIDKPANIDLDLGTVVIASKTKEETDPTVPEYVKTITEQDIESWNKIKNLGDVLRYKGSVDTYEQLPTTNIVGDVYNVVAAHGDYAAGTNFAWTEQETWDPLSGDLGSFVKNTDIASSTKLGLVKIPSSVNGIAIDESGNIYIQRASDSQLLAKNTDNPIVTRNLDKAIKFGLTTNTQVLTAEDKAAIKEWLGFATLEDIDNSINSALRGDY